MARNELEIRPLEAPLGAEVLGLDASVVPGEATVQALKRAIAEHCLILAREQALTEEQHLAFLGAFGPTEVPWLHAVEANTMERHRELPPLPAYTGAHGGVVYFCNGPGYRDEPNDGYLQTWHADLTHLQIPVPFVSLHALEAPERGYETWYSNQYLGYEALDAATRARVDGLSILHSYGHVFPNLAPVVQPVVLAHPRSGRRAIYGIPGFCDPYPLGVAPEEGARLMARLTAHLEDDRFLYKHRWRKADLVIWDNRCALHRRGPQVGGQTRVLRRITAGDGHAAAVRRALMGTG